MSISRVIKSLKCISLSKVNRGCMKSCAKFFMGAIILHSCAKIEGDSSMEEEESSVVFSNLELYKNNDSEKTEKYLKKLFLSKIFSKKESNLVMLNPGYNPSKESIGMSILSSMEKTIKLAFEEKETLVLNCLYNTKEQKDIQYAIEQQVKFLENLVGYENLNLFFIGYSQGCGVCMEALTHLFKYKENKNFKEIKTIFIASPTYGINSIKKIVNGYMSGMNLGGMFGGMFGGMVQTMNEEPLLNFAKTFGFDFDTTGIKNFLSQESCKTRVEEFYKALNKLPKEVKLCICSIITEKDKVIDPKLQELDKNLIPADVKYNVEKFNLDHVDVLNGNNENLNEVINYIYSILSGIKL